MGKGNDRWTAEQYKNYLDKKTQKLVNPGEPTIKIRQRQMNVTETRMYNMLKSLKNARMIQDFNFEGITFKLAEDVRYTPDFCVFENSGHLRFIETKGAHIFEDGMVKFKTAMSSYPMFIWEMWQYNSKSGEFDLIRSNCNSLKKMDFVSFEGETKSDTPPKQKAKRNETSGTD